MEVRKMDVIQEMNANERPIKPEIEKIRRICNRKRTALWRSAAKKQKWQRGLHFASGLITLLSGGVVERRAEYRAARPDLRAKRTSRMPSKSTGSRPKVRMRFSTS
jgi:hypothetical protein